MSPRAWLAFVAIAFALGGVAGWSLRISTAGDRYIRALAEKHESSARYWDTKTNEILTNNTLERKKRDGKKKD